MRQHAIRHQAEEKNWDQREEAEEHRSDHHVAHDAALAEDQCCDKLQAERLLLIAQAIVTLDDERSPIPQLLEPHAVEHERRILGARGSRRTTCSTSSEA